MINRRRFLSTASQSVIGAVALTALNRIEGEAAANKLSSIGVQLYTVRAEMAKDFEGSLEKVAAIGYKEVEFAGYYNKSPKDVRATLDRYGLAAPSAHASLADIQTKLDQTIETAKPCGGLCLASSHSIHSSVEPEKYLAMRDTLREYDDYDQ